MLKGINVEEAIWRELKHRAVDEGCSMGELVGKLVRGEVKPVQGPQVGWKEPAAATMTSERPVGRFGVPAAEIVPPPKQRVKSLAVSKPDLQSKVDAAIAEARAAYRVDPLDPRAGKSAKAAMAVPDSDDVEF